MQIYRAYTINADGHITQPPMVFSAEDDEEASSQAKVLANGHALEVWREDHLIVRLSADK